jgi:hypothetical protein
MDMAAVFAEYIHGVRRAIMAQSTNTATTG